MIIFLELNLYKNFLVSHVLCNLFLVTVLGSDMLHTFYRLVCVLLLQIFYQFELRKVLDVPNDSIIHQICVCPTDGNIIYACKNGKVYLVELDSWKTQLILNVPCLQVCKLKTFSLDNRLLVVMLVENVNGFWMLTVSIIYFLILFSIIWEFV